MNVVCFVQGRILGKQKVLEERETLNPVWFRFFVVFSLALNE